jgi:hypothetical protein
VIAHGKAAVDLALNGLQLTQGKQGIDACSN